MTRPDTDGTQTGYASGHDELVAELLRMVDTAATNGALAASPTVLKLVGEHTDAADMANVRHWLDDQASAMAPPPDQSHEDVAAAVSYALGVAQGTVTWDRRDRLRRVAESLGIKRPSLTQKKPGGGSRLKRLIAEFATAIESAPAHAAVAELSPRSYPDASEETFFAAPQAAYELAISEIDALGGDPTVTVDVASIRSSHDVRAARIESDYPEHVLALHESLEAHVQAGGHVRRVVAVTNLEQLQIECERQERLRETRDPVFYELRAFILDMTPGLSPLVIEGRCGLLGMSDPAAIGVLKACVCRSPAGIDFCTKAFDGLWNDSRARWLTTLGRGISAVELEGLRVEVKRLERRRRADRGA